jgi:cytochrome c oxidase subunit 3
MRQEFDNELSPEVKEKMRKNLIYLLMFSVFMVFAGLSSGYIVSMGDTFWLKYTMPPAFWISTAVIVLSSLFVHIGIKYAKKDNLKMAKIFVVTSFLLGLSFVYFQFKGYNQLSEQGIHAVNNHIIVTEGRYGDYFEVKYKGQFVDVNCNDYYVSGHKMSTSQFSDLQNFMAQFEGYERGKNLAISNYGKDFILYFKQQPLALINGKLTTVDGKELQFVDLYRLQTLAVNIGDSRGDFFVKGEIGKDFHIYYKGKGLDYKNRELYYKGRVLSKYYQIKVMETADTATSYLYIITFLHLLHIAVTLLYMIRVTIHSFSGRFTAEENLTLRASAIFWHFLGLLWIYLLLFLLFIH